MNKKHIYWLLLIILVAVLGWASGIATKIAVREASPFLYTFLRFVFAALFILPFVIHKIPKKNLMKLFLLSLFATWNVVLFAFGVKLTTATIGSMLYILCPMMALLFWYIFWKHKFSWLNIVWVVLWFFWAMIIILLPAIYGWNHSIWSLPGNLLVLAAVTSFTIYTVWSKSVQELFSPQIISAWFFFVTLIITWVISFIHPQQAIYEMMHLSSVTWLVTIFAWLVWTVWLYFLHQIIIKKASYLDASLSSYLQPIATVLLAVPILHEKITFLFVIGAIVTLVGVWLSSRKV